MKKAFYKILFLFFLLGADVLTKAGALHWIPPWQGLEYPFGGIRIFENFIGISLSLNQVENTGVAWGVFPNHIHLLLTLRIFIVSLLLIYLIFFRSKNRSFIPLGLIVTGAVGNIIDMLFYGHVIDFIHVQFFGWSFPVFNFADSFITIGVALMILWQQSKKEDQPLQ